MSSFYKRLISKQILSNISGDLAPTELQQLKRRLIGIIRVTHRHKNGSSDFHLVAALATLTKCLQGRSLNVEKLSSDLGVKVQVVDQNLHFQVEPSQFTKKVLDEIWSEKGKYGHQNHTSDSQEHVCVEYSSPNIAKPFHVGHLRSTIIGNIIANLYETAGHKVERINFLGDWGTQFGLLSLGLLKYSDQEKLSNDPLLELFRVYVKINQDVKSECGLESELNSQTYKDGLALFTKLEQGDDEMASIWRMIRGCSVVELDKMYQRLGVHFTQTFSESDYKDKTAGVLQRLYSVGLLKYSDQGLGYVDMDGQAGADRAVVVKSDGTSLYLTRDIASALDRQEKFAFDKVHYVVEHGQRGHFLKLVNIIDRLGVPWASRPVDEIHLRFGRVKGMSTRQGNVVFLRDLLDEAKTRVMNSITSRSTSRVSPEQAEKVADSLGVAAIILQDVKNNRINDYTFSWEQMLSFKSDSAIFVQYCHARLNGILSGCGVDLTEDIDVNCVMNDASLQALILHLARYSDVFQDSLNYLEPHHLVQYLFRLCHLVNGAYATCPIKGENLEIAQARLMVFQCAKQVLANVLQVLGLVPVDRM